MSKLDFNSVFGDKTLDFECPACKHTFKVKVSKISKDGSLITCLACNQDIEVTQDESAKKAISNINNGFKKLDKSLNRLKKFR